MIKSNKINLPDSMKNWIMLEKTETTSSSTSSRRHKAIFKTWRTSSTFSKWQWSTNNLISTTSWMRPKKDVIYWSKTSKESWTNWSKRNSKFIAEDLTCKAWDSPNWRTQKPRDRVSSRRRWSNKNRRKSWRALKEERYLSERIS